MRARHLIAVFLLLAPIAAQAQTAPVLAASPSSLSFTFAVGGTLPGHQIVMLSSSAGATQFSVATATASGGNWLQVAPSTGATPAMLTVQLDPFSSSLAAGLYNGTITVNQTLKIPVTLTVTTVVSAAPTSLTFSAQQGPMGTSTPAAQTVNVTSDSPVTVSAAAMSSPNWLSVSPASGATPATFTVSANPAGLAAGNYNGMLVVSSPAAPTVSIPVTLNVIPPLMFNLVPSSLNFISTSANPQPVAQTVSLFSNTPSPVVSSASTFSGGNWLSISQTGTQTPATLAVSINLSGLNPGTYNGQISVSATRGGTATPIPVTLVIETPQAPTLQVAPDTLTITSAPGGPPIQQELAVSNTGGGSLAFSVLITAQSGGNWLTLQANAGTAAAGSLVNIPFTINPGSLGPGTYTATLTATGASQTASTLIILAVGAQSPSLVPSQTGLSFNSIAQGANPPSQAVSIANLGATAVAWNVSTSTLSGGNWLSATPGSGTSQPLPAVAPTMVVSVNSQNLSAGTYYGSVKVNSQVISVQTTVLSAGQILSPTLSAGGLIFTAVAGGSNPVAQPVTIFNPLSFTNTVSTDDGSNWLSLTIPNAFSAAGQVNIQAAIASLTSGIRHGTIRLGFADSSSQTINVVSAVAPAGTSPQVRPATFFPDAGGSCPSVLIPQLTTLASGFTAVASQSTPLSVSVVDDCGHALANSTSSTVIASFYDATKPPGPGAKVQPDLKLTPQGNGSWSATWTPQASTAQLEIIVVALGINGTTPIAGQTTLIGNVQAAAAKSPALSLGIFNAASYQPGNTVALGSFVSIFGSNLADGSGAPATQPLPTSYQGTQVFLGGVALPLQYAGPSQINALIPANVAVDSQQPLIVQRDLTQAAPTAVTIADAQPGIYTANQQGTGQAAVLTSDNVLDAPVGAYPGSHPANRGGVIQIFCTGLGAVTNPPAPGAAAPNAPLSFTVATVSATIGGVNAPVVFSGLAPGFIGLYQVNATVPASAPVGGAVPLILTVGSTSSNTATIAVQ